MLRLRTYWDHVRTSLWAVPLAMVLAAACLAVVAARIRIDVGDSPVWFLYAGSAKEAPQFLGNLVSAMITMATLAISITMVVLTLAAQQLGPRLIRNFMRDWQTQGTLGLLIGTVVYLLLVLRSIYSGGDNVANLAITGGTVLVLACIAGLLLFVNHLAHAIVADNVIARVGDALDADIRRMLPEKGTKTSPPAPIAATGAAITTDQGGYVQAIDIEALVKRAAKADAFIELQVRPGHHAVPGAPIAVVSPPAATDDLSDAIRATFVIGRARNAVQDLEFSIHQLVEIALRALSPGINDPFTAIAVIDRLALSLRRIMSHAPARDRFADDKGIVRLAVPAPTFDGLCDAAYNQIRQAGGNQAAILIRMADTIGQLLTLADETQRAALEKHLRLVVNTGGRNLPEEADRNDLSEIVGHTRQALRTTATA